MRKWKVIIYITDDGKNASTDKVGSSPLSEAEIRAMVFDKIDVPAGLVIKVLSMQELN